MPTALFLQKAIFHAGTTILKKNQIQYLRAFSVCVVKDSSDAAVFNHPGALTKLALWVGEALAEKEKEATGKLAHGGRGTPLVVASLNEARGVFVVVGTGGGGGPDSAFVSREAARKKAEKRQDKAKLRAARRQAKENIRAEKAAARRRLREENQSGEGGDGEEQEDEGEGSDLSDTDSESDSDDDDDADDETANVKGYGLNKFGLAFQQVVNETNSRMRIDSFEHCVVEVRKDDLDPFLESLSMKAVVG